VPSSSQSVPGKRRVKNPLAIFTTIEADGHSFVPARIGCRQTRGWIDTQSVHGLPILVEDGFYDV
jgi:hypothetical protein